MTNYIIDFQDQRIKNAALVGGKNASLGEMIQELSGENILVPEGFATTANAYWDFLDSNDLRERIGHLLDKLDKENFTNLKETGKNIRALILDAKFPEDILEEIKKAYRNMGKNNGSYPEVAVRSSATAEDLPEASFAGQHETYLNIKGEEEVVNACKKCFASLFTDRAIKYREDKNFEHMKVALSAGVQRMVRSDLACAGVAFTIEPETGFDKAIFITGSWGLGENVVQGEVDADEFYLFKPSLANSKKAILSKKMGNKEKTMIYSERGKEETTTENTNTPEDKRHIYVLNDEELEQLGRWCMTIEKHYGKAMDIEWAKDGNDNKLYIVQARPETVHSTKEKNSLFKRYKLTSEGKIITRGSAIGSKIASGKAKVLSSPNDLDKLEKGDVLVTRQTNPDWDPVMKKASAIVTDSGGRTSHAAIVARELGVVAVVGTGDATKKIKDGQEVTVSCANGNGGTIYEGKLDWDEEEIDLSGLEKTETQVMLILGDPEAAFKYHSYPVQGVGLLRLEFVIANTIKIHPMALVKFSEIEDQDLANKIDELTSLYPNKEAYFVERLAHAVATIAAVFYPNDVIVRMSDFKSNEYANLLGGSLFEPKEENPMLGFRGASRYYHESYREGFRLECEAMKYVRNEMGLTNVKLMIPFCRTVDEGKKVLSTMAEFGLKQGDSGLEVYVMAELPSNVVLADQFAEIFDGFSIGSNDLTQLTLGIDRDSANISNLFDEKNEASLKMISTVIRKARKAGKKIGLCGQAPSDFPEMAKFLVKEGINSISFNPDAIATGMQNIINAEKEIRMQKEQELTSVEG